jgi:hypothetical protein
MDPFYAGFPASAIGEPRATGSPRRLTLLGDDPAIRDMLGAGQETVMEEYTEEFTALEARRIAALEKLRETKDPHEIRRLQAELAQIDSAIEALGEEDA